MFDCFSLINFLWVLGVYVGLRFLVGWMDGYGLVAELVFFEDRDGNILRFADYLVYSVLSIAR